MPSLGNQLMLQARIAGIMQGLTDVREQPGDLVALNRTPIIPSTDADIIARYVGRIIAADVLPSGQAAFTYSAGKVNLESNNIPTLKAGYNLTAPEIEALRAINRGAAAASDPQGVFSQMLARLTAMARQGVRQRMEHLLWGMLTDSYVYNRRRIQFSMTWGMPSDLKVALSGGATWDSSATAVPVDDVLTQVEIGQARYGINFNRASMGRTTFRYMTKTTDFINRAKAALIQYGASSAPLPQQQLSFMRPLAEDVLGMAIEIYDKRFWEQGQDDTLASKRYLPVNSVVLSDSSNDNNSEVMDFANAPVTEAIVAELLGEPLNGVGGDQYGPIAYPTGPEDLNPAEITFWGVGRGIPRKKLLQASSVITAGTYTDLIAVGEPF